MSEARREDRWNATGRLNLFLLLAGALAASSIYFSGEARAQTDDALAVQQRIDAAEPGSTVRLAAGTYQFYNTVRGRSGVTVACAPGAVIQRPRGAYRGSSGSGSHVLIRLDNVSNATVSGCAFDGNTDEQPFYDEHDHSVSVKGSSNVRVSGNTFSDTPGDGVYLGDSAGSTSAPACNSDTTVFGNTMRGANKGRNGISIICGRRIDVLDNDIRNFSRPKMPGGIALEPNRSQQFLEDIVVSGNEVHNRDTKIASNNGVVLYNVSAQAPVRNVSIKNNIIRGYMQTGVLIRTPPSSQNVSVSGNTVREINGERYPWSIGIKIVDAKGTLVTKNTISNINGYCTYKQNSSPTIKDNRTSGCRKQ